MAIGGEKLRWEARGRAKGITITKDVVYEVAWAEMDGQRKQNLSLWKRLHVSAPHRDAYLSDTTQQYTYATSDCTVHVRTPVHRDIQCMYAHRYIGIYIVGAWYYRQQHVVGILFQLVRSVHHAIRWLQREDIAELETCVIMYL